MSLFLVHRYLGEEEEGTVSRESQSQVLLAKLQQKVKQKQRQSLTELKESVHDKQTEQQDVKKKREADKDNSHEHLHLKKRKLEAGALCDSDPDSCDAKQKKKKKKKKQPAEGVSPVSKGDGAEYKEGQELEEADKTTRSPEKTSVPAGFTVLGGFESKALQKVHRVLPQWLAEPDVIHRDIKSNLVPTSAVSGVCAQLLKKLETNGIQHFFPVQAEVIPAILEGAQHGLLIGGGGYRPRDICVSAPTGSGKTLSFVIPVIQVLMQRVVREVRALAVLPTKELAQQVYKVFTSYAGGTPLKVLMLAGQKSFAAEQASLSEQRGSVRRSAADIIVATPGRLVDHINKNSGLCLKQLRFLIIDEADRMIDSMHQSWLSQVVKEVYGSGAVPEATSIFRRTEAAHITAASLSPPQMPLQKLLFSATLTQNPEKLQQLGLHQPRLFSSIHSPSNSTAADPSQKQDRFDFPQGLTEYYVSCTMDKKPLLILHFILCMKLCPVLCFTNSRETAHRLYLLVKLFGGVQSAEFSSRLSPGERKKTLKDFEQGKIQLLISTDAAARGIDINGVKCVVNYDAPQYIRTYIHRIGRTARAGKAGLAFTLLLRVQETNFLQMVVEAGSPGIQKQVVKPETLKSMEAQYEQILQELARVIKVPSQTPSVNK
ncbi:ATP-dependent RNA helicase DDX51 isoform X1 [Kryptolebias marmoratus]|uniref:ATP-dependent RNA helicase DDX51 isoform X1 n=1 Tax=Kryptolebias marmoratus TaxID=37003 RepID=UPI0007F8EC86|nr:ATP-dependent RNA helicase DDX51 isoform X1 [Kryptolebias marmoratus]